jgi:O-antigen ligase
VSAVSEGILLSLLVLLPAAIDPAGVLAVEPVKTSLMRVGAALLAGSWITYRFTAAPRVDVGAHPVVRAGLALVALAAISTALSIEPVLSFFGGFDRGMGWLTLAAGAVLLVVTADLLADERRREHAVTALLLGAVIPCAYMLLQAVGFDPVHWVARGAPGSTLGSPTFLGGYLVIVVPFAVYRVVVGAQATLHGGRSFTYAAWLAFLLIICAVILLTTIRAPLLGAAVGLITFAALMRGRRAVRRVELLGAASVLVAVAVMVVVATGSGGLRTFQRFLTIGGPIDSSSQRLTVWQESIATLIADPSRLLIGYGDETQSAVFEHREAILRRTPVELWDRAHNLLLDSWLTHGLAGLLALLVVLLFALRSAWSAHRGGSLLAKAVIAALVGHFVEVNFAFHSVTTEALFWVLLGLAASLTPRRLYDRPRRHAKLAILGVGAAALLAPLVATPAVADWLYGAARRTSFDVGAQLEEQAATWAPWVEELPRAAGLDWQQVATRRNDSRAAARAEQDLLQAARLAPLAPEPQIRLTRLYLERADFGSAEAACQQAIANGPYRAIVWDACADVSQGQGQTDLAATRRARADELRNPLYQ